MNTISGTKKYFKQPTLALGFVILSIAAGKQYRSDKMRIWQQFIKWKEQRIESGEYFSEADYKTDAITWEDYTGISRIIPDNVNISFSDLNNDGKTDGIVEFTAMQYDDSDETLMSSRERIQILSTDNDYIIVDGNIYQPVK